MARQSEGDKPGDIRKATVEEVAHVGSTAVSVNKIAKRAGVSVGTLYRFHRSKDDLLFSVFLDIKIDIHCAMMAAAEHEEGSAARLKALWFALVDYGFRAPAEFQLIEIMSSETRADISMNEQLKIIQSDVRREFQEGIDSGTLVDVDVQTIEAMLAYPAIFLARRVGLSGEPIGLDEIENIFSLIWRGIAKDRP